MLVRLVVITLCAAIVAGELQCSGPGRYSTTPGMCTSEYYTCYRDVNKEYIAYVLSCPGKTIFNERNRKCTSAKTVTCIPPSNTTPSGQIKVTTPRRQKLTTEQISSWISRPSNGYQIKQLVEYRKPGKVPWVTPKPYLLSTLAMTTKPQTNQWRIRTTTTKRTTTAKSTKLLPAKVMIRKSHPPVKHKEKPTSQPVKRPVYQHATAIIVNLSTSPVSQQSKEVLNLTTNSISTSAAHTFEPLTTLQEKNVNITTTSTMYSDSTNTVIPSSFQAVTSRNILALTTANPTHSTVKLKSVSDVPLNVICDQLKTQITPGFFTHPYVISTSPPTSNVDSMFETTPEVVLKYNKNPIPFMDSLESNEQNSDMEIVHIDFNSSSEKAFNHTQPELMKENITPIKHIRYFYDPETNPTLSQRLVNRTANSFKTPNKKNKQKILQKRQRQPK